MSHEARTSCELVSEVALLIVCGSGFTTTVKGFDIKGLSGFLTPLVTRDSTQQNQTVL